MNSRVYKSLYIDRAGVIRPDLIPLAAFLVSAQYSDHARGVILDHAAAGAPLSDLCTPAPDGWVVLDREDLFPAVAALAAGRLRDHAAETN